MVYEKQEVIDLVDDFIIDALGEQH